MDAGATRPDLTAKLRAPSAAASRCKVCGGEARPVGIVDFNRCSEEARGVRLPRTGVPVQYRRCGACGLLFTETFDDWEQADFEAHIYNDGYPTVDADYAAKRPEQMAGLVARLFAPFKAQLDILDYGGGNGRLAEVLGGGGFRCATYDPFTPRFAERPHTRFRLITCVETLEHMPDPARGVADIADLLADGGAVLFTTLVQPADIGKLGLGWWYVGPRNGHVTLFSRQALARLWARFGFTLGAFDDNLHLAYRGPTPPDIVRHLAGGASAAGDSR